MANYYSMVQEPFINDTSRENVVPQKEHISWQKQQHSNSYCLGESLILTLIAVLHREAICSGSTSMHEVQNVPPVSSLATWGDDPSFWVTPGAVYLKNVMSKHPKADHWGQRVFLLTQSWWHNVLRPKSWFTRIRKLSVLKIMGESISFLCVQAFMASAMMISKAKGINSAHWHISSAQSDHCSDLPLQMPSDGVKDTNSNSGNTSKLEEIEQMVNRGSPFQGALEIGIQQASISHATWKRARSPARPVPIITATARSIRECNSAMSSAAARQSIRDILRAVVMTYRRDCCGLCSPNLHLQWLAAMLNLYWCRFMTNTVSLRSSACKPLNRWSLSLVVCPMMRDSTGSCARALVRATRPVFLVLDVSSRMTIHRIFGDRWTYDREVILAAFIL